MFSCELLIITDLDGKLLDVKDGSYTVSIGNSVYVWSGDNDAKKEDIQYFPLSTGQWVDASTTGRPPAAMWGCSCAAIHRQWYFFGGWCDRDSCYHNSITQLDTISLQWREIEPNATGPVMKRAYGGMISLENDGMYYLLVIGGKGSQPTIHQRCAQYFDRGNGTWRTNEHSLYSILSSKFKHKYMCKSILGV